MKSTNAFVAFKFILARAEKKCEPSGEGYFLPAVLALLHVARII